MTPLGFLTYSALQPTGGAAAAATDLFTLTGATGVVVRLSRIVMVATAKSSLTVSVGLIKRTTLDTGGTSTALTPTAYDDGSPAAAATATYYTANPTALGTSGGIIANNQLETSLAGSVPSVLTFDFSTAGLNPSLRSATQQFALNLGGATILTPSINLWVEWTESPQ